MAFIEKSELPFLHLSYQQDMRVLFCRWRMPVELPQFSEGYMAALQFAAQQDAHFWLHDLRLRNRSTEEEQDWFTHVFVPAANEQLGGSNFIAYLMTPLQRESLVQITVPAAELVRHSLFLTVRYFTNEHDALEWLNDCRVRVVA
ncbi:hypothetical protein DXT99_16000 [Pontibacter diazotrophicus]|uniref:STAS/SEC14 domain-containing protein n=1 Tax=Pontibacter diazotrophicus TaxID=1400979 RepID=A0A3D8L9I9_9BACT|nr:hypothetical protein [Pontibacter diazotrophicus]RDV14070.1 hypothetical protein DXT99_16000 [Pontibacter diazotrophicus]